MNDPRALIFETHNDYIAVCYGTAQDGYDIVGIITKLDPSRYPSGWWKLDLMEGHCDYPRDGELANVIKKAKSWRVDGRP